MASSNGQPMGRESFPGSKSYLERKKSEAAAAAAANDAPAKPEKKESK